MTLTQWFCGYITPDRDGVYERDYGGGHLGYCYFDGDCWHFRADTPVGAEANFGEGVGISSFVLPWRGLAEKPSRH